MNRLERLTSEDLRRLADALDTVPIELHRPHKVSGRTVAVDLDSATLDAYLQVRFAAAVS